MEQLRARLRQRKIVFPTLESLRRQVLLISIIEAFGIIATVSFLFYNSIFPWGILLLPYTFFHYKFRKRFFEQREKNGMAQSFKDGMLAVKNALQASYSIENAIKEALEELELLHGRTDRIYLGFNKIVNQLSINIPIEEAFCQFAEENQIEEICNFAEILKYAKRSSGNLTEIIKNTAEIITEKIEVQREIQVVTAAKRFEMLIMSVVPAGIILYMRLSSFNTMEKLYGNIFGIIVMTICLGIYGGSILLAVKISKIKI